MYFCYLVGIPIFCHQILKHVFLLSCGYTNILPPDSQTLKSLFLKINFSPICYDVINEMIISGERNIKHFCTKIELKKQLLILGNSKKSILNFWPNWSISMCWTKHSFHFQIPVFSGITEIAIVMCILQC